MKITPSSEQTAKLLREAKEIALIGKANPDVDTVASLLGLASILESGGKKVWTCFEGGIPEPCRDLPGAGKIKGDLGPRNLLVSLDLTGSPIEKVSYSVDDDTFNFIVTPQHRSFNIENVRYSYQGGHFHLLVTLGAPTLADLGEIYSANKEDFEKTPLLNISNHNRTEEFGQINLIDSSVSTLSELLFRELPLWDLKPTPAAARCLLTGLSSQTE